MANFAKDGYAISTLLSPHYPPKHKKYFWDKERNVPENRTQLPVHCKSLEQKKFVLLMGTKGNFKSNVIFKL